MNMLLCCMKTVHGINNNVKNAMYIQYIYNIYTINIQCTYNKYLKLKSTGKVIDMDV